MGSTPDSAGASAYPELENAPLRLHLGITVSPNTAVLQPSQSTIRDINQMVRWQKDLATKHILDLYKSEKEREKQESVEKEAKRRSFIAEKSKQKQPIPTASVGPSGGVSPQTNGPSRMNSAHIEVLSRFHIDYNEFEQGLPPPDPFDAPKTIQQELQEVMQASRASRESAATPFSTAYASMAPPLPAPLHSQSGFTSQPAAFPTPNFITSSPSSSSSLFSSPGYNYYRPTVQSTSQPPPPLPPKVQAQSTELDELTAKLLSMDLTDDQISSALRASNGNEQIATSFAQLLQPLQKKSYSLANIEVAFSVHQTNIQKCEEFLNVFVQLKELGFPIEKVKNAIIKGGTVEVAVEELMRE